MNKKENVNIQLKEHTNIEEPKKKKPSINFCSVNFELPLKPNVLPPNY